MLRIFSVIIFLAHCPVFQSIGPGFSHFKSRMLPDPSQSFTSSGSSARESSMLPYTDEANSYAYWNCHTIPPNMTLCKSVGYSRMVLPNFLQHESLREVIQQANVWVALVNTDCHPDIQRFLCSLYAPVCLKSHQEAKIPPCWELCDQVRNACLPRMRLFGFDWPDIVQCRQFPRLAESMCIPPQENTAVTCAPCEQAVTLENIASSYCMADVVLRASIQDVIPMNNRAALHLKLSPRSRALKLAGKDGVVTTSVDYRQKQKRQRKFRHRIMKSRMYRHLEAPRKQYSLDSRGAVKSHKPTDQGLTKTHVDGDRSLRVGRSVPQWSYNTSRSQDPWGNSDNSQKRGMNLHFKRRRRRPRDSVFQDLDGITELQLDCSACSRLIQHTTDSEASGLQGKLWLVMGRRMVDDKTKRFTNQVQVTFLTIWDRNSVEFRRSLNAIRNQPVSQLCPQQQSAIVNPVAMREGESTPSRNLKILRSAPHELSDAPSTDSVPSIGNHNAIGQSHHMKLRGAQASGNVAHPVQNYQSDNQPTTSSAQKSHTANKNNARGSHRAQTELNQQTPQSSPYYTHNQPQNAPAYGDQLSTVPRTPSRLLETQMLYSRWMNHFDDSENTITRRERRRRRRLERQRWRQLTENSGRQPSSLSQSAGLSNPTTSPTRPINPYGNEPASARAMWVH